MDFKRWVYLFCLLTVSSSKPLKADHLPISKQGVLDLSQVNFLEQTSVPLSGDWEFQWNELTSPVTNFNEASHPNKSKELSQIQTNNYISIGKRWKEIHSGIGFSTYRLKIIFPEGSHEQIFGIRFYQTGGSAMRVFVDGTLSLTLGEVGTTKETMQPTRSSGIVIIPYPKKEVSLLVHISNFHHDDGSFWYAPSIGIEKNIRNELSKEMIIDSLLAGALFFMAFYHFVLFFFWRTRKLSLFFGLFSFITALHSISLNGDLLYYIYREVPYRFAFSLSLIFYLAMPLYLYFLSQLYPNRFSKWIMHGFASICIFLYSLVIFLPTELGSLTTFYGIFFSIAGLLYATFILFISAIQKQELAFSLLLIQIFLVVSAVNDTLYLYGIIHFQLILKYSYLSTVLFQSLLLGSFFTKTFTKNETLKNELATLNESLEKTVILRTNEYKEAKLHAEEANQWKDKLISLVAHDLRSPLSTVYSAITLANDKDTTPEEKSHIYKQVFTILESAMSTIENLLNLNRFQKDKGQFHLYLEETPILNQLQLVLDSFAFEMQKKSLQFDIQIPKSAVVFADRSILSEILRNIISNAIKFSHPNGKIKASCYESMETCTISIFDSGQGIPSEQQKILFTEPVSSPGTLGEKGFGIGLKLCFELMKLHNGNIRVESELGKGSQFHLEFPKPKDF